MVKSLKWIGFLTLFAIGCDVVDITTTKVSDFEVCVRFNRPNPVDGETGAVTGFVPLPMSTSIQRICKAHESKKSHCLKILKDTATFDRYGLAPCSSKGTAGADFTGIQVDKSGLKIKMKIRGENIEGQLQGIAKSTSNSPPRAYIVFDWDHPIVNPISPNLWTTDKDEDAKHSLWTDRNEKIYPVIENSTPRVTPSSSRAEK